MKRLFKFKYPKIFILVLAIILAYYIFSDPNIASIVSHLGALSYLGIFIAGMFFSFGFTAPFAVGFFITLNPPNIWIAGIIGGLGAMLSDLIIFKLIKFSFNDEFVSLKREKFSKKLKNIITKFLGKRRSVYLIYLFAGILIASPLPDEAGIIMLAGITKIKPSVLAIVGFILNSIGIMILLIM